MIVNIILGILVCVGLIYLMEKYIPLKYATGLKIKPELLTTFPEPRVPLEEPLPI